MPITQAWIAPLAGQVQGLQDHFTNGIDKMETRIEATERLRREGRWPEATAHRERLRLELRAAGKPRQEANDEAWNRVIEEYPPLPAPDPVPVESIERAVAVAEIPSVPEAAPVAFESALRSLPATTTISKELDWISTHSAMNRQDRSPDKLKTILITAEDVLQAANGPAPSQRAVRQLQHWCNTPREFFKQILGEHKKQTEDADVRIVDQDENLEDVERMLREFSRQWEEKLAENVPSAVRNKVRDELADLERVFALAIPVDAREGLERRMSRLAGDCIRAAVKNPKAFSQSQDSEDDHNPTEQESLVGQ